MLVVHEGQAKKVKQVLLSAEYLMVEFYDLRVCYKYQKEQYAEYAYKSLRYYLKTKGTAEVLENEKVRFILKRASTVYSTINQANEVSVYCKKCKNIIPYLSHYCPKCGMPLKDDEIH